MRQITHTSKSYEQEVFEELINIVIRLELGNFDKYFRNFAL